MRTDATFRRQSEIMFVETPHVFAISDTPQPKKSLDSTVSENAATMRICSFRLFREGLPCSANNAEQTLMTDLSCDKTGGYHMDSRRFRFGLFEFDAATLQLRREGILVRLQSQPAQVLGCLIERAGQVVSREDLCKAVWDRDTFVDFDRGLNFCISQLRSTLKDHSEQPAYIRTIPKSGYQFIAPVERIGEAASSSPGAPAPSTNGHSRNVAAWIWAGLLFIAFGAAAGFWVRSWALSKRPPVVAVARFDNETADPGMTRFADGLTDNVVEELTSMSGGRYAVIGNAQILRLGREQRDLKAIGASLHAEYVVLGQVQTNEAETRILVHLIRLPDQTHLWVIREDGAFGDPLNIESGTARKVGIEFSKRIIADSSGHRLPGLPNR